MHLTRIGAGAGSVNAPSRDRGSIRRLLDLWGFVAPFPPPARNVMLTTRDDVRLAATYLPGPLRPEAASGAVVLAHGFAGHSLKPAYALLAQHLNAEVAVLAVDLRGHGASAGRCTFGDREVHDLRAAAAWLRARGHRWVGVVGASMGGGAAIRAAGCGPPGLFDAVCAISAPGQWGLRTSRPMRALARLRSPWYRVPASALLGVRISGRWAAPAPPLAVVRKVAPTPLLIVHGADDHYFGPEQARLLYAEAADPRTLWIEPSGFGHAEDGFTPAFARRLNGAVATVLRTGAWPQRDLT